MLEGQAAEALGRAIAAARNESPVEIATRTQLADNDRWASAHFFAQALAAARIDLGVTPVSLQRSLPNVDIDSLLKHGMIRVCLGRIDLPLGVREALNAPREPVLEAHESIQRVADVLGPPNRRHPRISRFRFERLLGRHGRTHPGTLSVGELEAQKIIEIDHSRGDVELLRPPLRSLALLWHERSSAKVGTAGSRFRDWFERARTFTGWNFVPRLLGRENREQWLDAAVELVLAEPDLRGDIEQETHRLRWERDPALWQLPVTIHDRSLISLSRRWSALEDLHSKMPDSGSGSVRRSLEDLINAILLGDPLEGRYLDRGRWIKALLAASEGRPALLWSIGQALPHIRPEALPWLLLQADLLPLALILVRKTPFTTTPEWTSQEELLEQRRQRRLVSWSESARIATRVLRQTSVRTDRAPTALVDAVLPLARDAFRARLTHPHGQLRTTESHWYLDEFLQKIRTSIVDQRHHHAIIDGWAANLAEGLAAADVPGALPEPYETSARLYLLFWFCKLVDSDSRLSSGLRSRAVEDCLRTISNLYIRLLDDPPILHTAAPESLVNLPWHLALTHGVHGSMLRLPPPLKRLLAESSDEEDNAERLSRYEVRLHLSVLLQAWASAELTHRGELEASVAEVAGRASDDLLLGPAGVRGSFMADRGAGLALVDALNEFSPEPFERVVHDWLERTDDMHIVARAYRTLTSVDARLRLKTRLMELASIRGVDDAVWWPELMEELRALADADQGGLARQIVDRLQTRLRGPNPDWDRFAFEAKLELAYRDDDHRSVVDLPLPDSLSTDPDPLERKRQLFVALLEPDHPDHQKTFEELLTAGDARTATDRFLSEVSHADRHSDRSRRRKLLLDALRRFERLEPALPEAQGPEKRKILAAKLKAHREVDDPASLDRLFQKLPRPYIYHEEVLVPAYGALLGAGRTHDALQLKTDAMDYHRSSDPDSAHFLEDQLDKVGLRPAPLGELRRQYQTIKQLSANDLAQVMTGGTVADALLGMFREAAYELLDRQTTLRFSSDENRWNDVFISLIRPALNSFGWQIGGGQDRGGLPDSGPKTSGTGGVGERDWIVRDSRGTPLSIGEAFILERDKRSHRHIERIIRRYDPMGLSCGFVVVYAPKDPTNDPVETYRSHVSSFGTSHRQLAWNPPQPAAEGSDYLHLWRTPWRAEGRSVDVYHLLLTFSQATS